MTQWLVADVTGTGFWYRFYAPEYANVGTGNSPSWTGMPRVAMRSTLGISVGPLLLSSLCALLLPAVGGGGRFEYRSECDNDNDNGNDNDKDKDTFPLRSIHDDRFE